MHRTTNRKKVNGHAGRSAATLACPEERRGCAQLSAEPLDHDLGKAGSDDASVLSVANAACSTTAGADRQACADLAKSAAQARSGGAAGPAAAAPASTHVVPPESATKGVDHLPAEPEPQNRFAAVPPGRKRLPVDGEAFVNAVHRQVDLIELEVTLLRDSDQKIVQRELAALRELRYGKRAPENEDEPIQIIHDGPRPERDPQ